MSSMAHEDDLGLFGWPLPGCSAVVHRYDARGHGKAEGGYEERCYRWSAMVDDMVRAAGEGPFVAAGIGVGAATALYAAIKAPRRVEALVLVLPPAGWEDRPPSAICHAEDADLVETRGLSALCAAVSHRPTPPLLAAACPSARSVEARHLRQMDEKRVVAILRGSAGADLPPPADVRLVIVPTLILGWAGDGAHPVSTAERLSALMIQSELVVATGLDGVREWPSRVARFLASV